MPQSKRRVGPEKLYFKLNVYTSASTYIYLCLYYKYLCVCRYVKMCANETLARRTGLPDVFWISARNIKYIEHLLILFDIICICIVENSKFIWMFWQSCRQTNRSKPVFLIMHTNLTHAQNDDDAVWFLRTYATRALIICMYIIILVSY